MPEEKDTVSFFEKGDTIVMKATKPDDFVMDSKELLIQIKSLEDIIDKIKKQEIQLKANLVHGAKTVEGNQGRLNKLKKFEAKMVAIQESKAKAIFNDVKEECRKKVEEEYKEDRALTVENNKAQKWRIYQQKIATHERVAKELAPTIMQKMYFKESILDNPWK